MNQTGTRWKASRCEASSCGTPVAARPLPPGFGAGRAITPRAILFPLFLAAALASHGYDFLTRTGLRWRDGDIPMNLQLDATMTPRSLTDGNTSWNDVAQQAIDLWNAQLSRVQFTTFTSVQQGDGNNHNEVFFSSDIYGHRFGPDVLAVTSTWRIGSERVEGDTIFNTAIQWDSYRGPIVDFFNIDLRRVAAHEFGHTLGLDHPNEARQVVAALMNSTISDLDTITADGWRCAHSG